VGRKPSCPYLGRSGLGEVARRGAFDRTRMLAMLKPCPDDALKIWPVNKAVGNVKDKGMQPALPTRYRIRRGPELGGIWGDC
jgi:hypothetical protein